MFKRIMLIIGCLIFLAVLASAGGYYYFIRLPLPTTHGKLQVKGLQAPVKVLRDRSGVPHIYADNEHDLFLAQGFVQAQDRLWQMEMNRRVAAGRLSEIIGPETLETDRLLRTLGFMRAAKEELATCDAVSIRILKAFSEGVNAFIDSRGSRLPIEFRLLGVRPEPWRPVDSIAWGKVMGFLGGKNWQEEIVRAMLAQRLGPEKAKSLLDLNQAGTRPIITTGPDLSGQWPLSRGLHADLFSQPGGASNNWAVHGSRTDTGFPLVANDMHLVVNIPSVWYEMHLVGGEFDVIGLSLPGVPLIIAGHNREVAWGITFAYVDVEDLFIERMDTDKRGKYLYKGQWLDAELTEELIRVKGQDKPSVHEVWRTRHGPIISPQVPGAQALKYTLSLRWSGHDPGCMIKGFRALDLAQDTDEFMRAAQDWTEPAMNLVFADRDGNIGYVLASRVPIRRHGHGIGPFPGWTGEYEWSGYLSPGEKPFSLNPSKGFIATANNRIIGPSYAHYLAEDYAPGFRAARISEALSKKDKISSADFRTLQGDLKCLPAAEFMATLNGIEVQDPEARYLMKTLKEWDQVLGPDSAGGAIYSVLFYRLMENTFRDELGDVTDRFFGVGLTPLEPLTRFTGHSRVIFQKIMSDRNSPWFDDVNTPDQENFSSVLKKSLRETAAFLKKKLGPDRSSWTWGRLHRVVFEHPLGKVKPLDRIFNLGPFAGGGHFSTVFQSAVMPGMDFDLKGWTASNRHIYDLKDWDKSLGAIVPGQSGMFGSPHYADQVDLWLQIMHHPLDYSLKRVEAEAKDTLILEP